MVDPALPVGHHLDALERLGKIVNTVGIPLILVLFMAINLGWVDSPLSRSLEANTAMNQRILDLLGEHDRQMRAAEAVRVHDLKEAIETVRRLGDLIKIIDCGAVMDPKLRDRCLAR